MLRKLKKLASLENDTRLKGYRYMKYPHPDSGKKPSGFPGHATTLEEAQEFCDRPEHSFKEGPTKDWYFIGYVEQGSRTCHLTLWDALS